MIRYTVTSGKPTPEELVALEEALKQHRRPRTTAIIAKTRWGRPQLRSPLPRKA